MVSILEVILWSGMGDGIEFKIFFYKEMSTFIGYVMKCVPASGV